MGIFALDRHHIQNPPKRLTQSVHYSPSLHFVQDLVMPLGNNTVDTSPSPSLANTNISINADQSSKKKKKKKKTKTKTKTNPKLAAKNKHNVTASSSQGQASKTLCCSPNKTPIQLQQLLLNIFKNAFPTNFNSHLAAVVQEVKQNLFHRDFQNAFGNQASLEAYAIRWSPGRALVYLDIFCNRPELSANLLSCLDVKRRVSEQSSESCENSSSVDLPAAPVEPKPRQLTSQGPTSDPLEKNVRIVCIGGGAGAEMVALAGYLRFVDSSVRTDHISGHDEKRKPGKLNITAVDIADWSSIVDKLYSSLTTTPPVPKYASMSAQALNMPLVDLDAYEVRFLKQDVLKIEEGEMQALLRDATIVTLMFTLNELYSTSISATTNLLLSMTSILESGSLLLVVDSPGSYSTINLGKVSAEDDSSPQKKYPMQWLLDHTLLEAATINTDQGKPQEKQWEKLYSHDSTWFRLPAELTYPITLEDMRYQIHLYRRS